MTRQPRTFGAMLVVVIATCSFTRPAHAQTMAVVSVQSFDALRSDGRYLLRLAGQAELAKQLDDMLEMLSGNKGLAGVDTKRPIGLYVNWPKIGEQPPVVAFVPVADPESFLDLLKSLNADVVKGDDDIYVMTPQVGAKNYLRFAHKHVFGAVDPVFLRGKLPEPGKLLSKLHQENSLAASFYFEQLPAELRQAVIQQMDLAVQQQKERQAGENEPHYQGRMLGAKLMQELILSLIEDGKQLTFNLQIDQKRDKLILDLALSARPGSSLAKKFSSYGSAQSGFNSLALDSAASLVVHVPIAAELRSRFGKIIAQGIQEDLRQEADPAKKDLIERTAKEIGAALQLDTLDFALALRGPHDDQKYVVVGGLRVKEGKRVEAFFRELVKTLPAPSQAQVKLDHAKVGDTSIHLIEEELPLPPAMKKLLGSATSAFFIKNDMLLFAVGAHGLEELQQTLQKPRRAPNAAPVQLELSARRLSPFVKEYHQELAVHANKIFSGKQKNQDMIRLTLRGGDALQLRLEMDTHLYRLLEAR